MSGVTSADQVGVLEGSYSPVFISIFKYLDKKQDFRKSKSHIVRSYRCSCQIKRPICHYILNANWNRPSMSKNHEKWSSSIKNRRYIYHSKNPLWWKRPKLHLCYSLKIFRRLYSLKQHAQRAHRQQQVRPQTDKTHHEMLQPSLRKQPSMSGFKQEFASIPQRPTKKPTRWIRQEMLQQLDEKSQRFS